MEIVPVEEIPQAQSVPVDSLSELYNTFVHMRALCLQQEGIGLSAVQVGIPWRFFIERVESDWKCFVNCDYEAVGDEKLTSVEGCLSLKRDNLLRRFVVRRFAAIRLFGQQLLMGDKLALEDINMSIEDPTLSVVYQHEVDHQKKVLISNIGEEVHLWT